MTSVIGVDPGVRKVACVDLSCLLWTYESPPEGQRPGVCFDVFQAVLSFFSGQREDAAVFVEEPVIGVNRRVAMHQGQIHGVVLAAALQSGITSVYSVSNTAWKKETVGNGKVKKSDCLEWLRKQEPTLAEKCEGDDDLCDAACIAIYGTRVLSRAGQLAHRVPGTE
jgi:Holliday junction resolvasome RuvABC endonuclease subunit